MFPAKTLYFENHVLPRIAGSSMGLVIDSWLCLRLYSAELSVPLGAGVSLFCILNIEYRTRNFEQQKFLKEIRQCFLLRYSAVPCSAVLRFIFLNPSPLAVNFLFAIDQGTMSERLWSAGVLHKILSSEGFFRRSITPVLHDCGLLVPTP